MKICVHNRKIGAYREAWVITGSDLSECLVRGFRLVTGRKTKRLCVMSITHDPGSCNSGLAEIGAGVTICGIVGYHTVA